MLVTPNMTRPSSFMVLGNYLNKDGRALWTSYRGLNSDFPWRVNDRIMEATARTAPRQSNAKPPIHFMLNAHPNDRHISREEWEIMADRTIDHMGLNGHQAKIVEHPDAFFKGKQRQHIHIMVNAVREDGKSWRIQSKRNPKNFGSGDYKWMSRMDELCRIFEEDFGLLPLDTPLTAYREGREWPNARKPNRAEEEIDKRTGRTPDIPMKPEEIKEFSPIAKEIIATGKSWEEIQERLSAELGYTIKAKGPGLILSGEGGKYAKLSSLGKVKFSGQDKAERLTKDRIGRDIGETWEDYWNRQLQQQEATKRELKSKTYLSESNEDIANFSSAGHEDGETSPEFPATSQELREDGAGPVAKSNPHSASSNYESYDQDQDYGVPQTTPYKLPDPTENVPLREFTLEELEEWRTKLHDRVALARSWAQLEAIARSHGLRLAEGWALHDGTCFLRLSAIDGLGLKRRQNLYLETYGEYVLRRSQGKNRTKFKAEQNQKFHLKQSEINQERDRGHEDEQEI